MTDAISDASVALSLMLEALRMLDGPEHSKAAAHLRAAIEAAIASRRATLASTSR